MAYGRYVITGAGGWVGRAAASFLPSGASVLVARTPRLEPINGLDRRIVGMDALAQLEVKRGTLFVHAGFPTQDQVERMGEASYDLEVRALRRSVVGALKRLGPLDLIYVSSGAASTVEREQPAAPRTATYGAAKLEDEAALREATRLGGGRLCIVRAFALSGPYMTKPDAYALGNMICQAARAGSIEVAARGPVRRSYMAIRDMLRIAMHAVDQLDAGESITFETAGEVVEVGGLAARVLGVMSCDSSAVVRPEYDPDAPSDDYLGETEVVGRLAEAAGVVPASLDDQIAVTAEWLRSEHCL